jgi:hypothetical protein
MPFAAVLTLIGTAILVALIAVYLIYVAFILKHVVGKLETILNAVGEVSKQSVPIGPVAGAINADLEAAARALQAALPPELQQTNGHQSTGAQIT